MSSATASMSASGTSPSTSAQPSFLPLLRRGRELVGHAADHGSRIRTVAWIYRPEDMDAAAIATRLLDGDASLWPSPNVAATRLGWLTLATDLENEANDAARVGRPARALARRAARHGRLVARPRGVARRDRFGCADSARHDRAVDGGARSPTILRDAVVIVSSKSGGTLEIQTLLARCWEVHPDASKYVAITDPGTGLDDAGDRARLRPRLPQRPEHRRPLLGAVVLRPRAGRAARLRRRRAARRRARRRRDRRGERRSRDGRGRARGTRQGDDPCARRSSPSSGCGSSSSSPKASASTARAWCPIPTTEPEKGDDRHHMTRRPVVARRARPRVHVVGTRDGGGRSRARRRSVRRTERGREQGQHQARARRAAAAVDRDRRRRRRDRVAARADASRATTCRCRRTRPTATRSVSSRRATACATRSAACP